MVAAADPASDPHPSRNRQYLSQSGRDCGASAGLIGWNIQAYTVTYEVAHDFNVNPVRLTELGAVAALINCAKRDLNRGITK